MSMNLLFWLTNSRTHKHYWIDGRCIMAMSFSDALAFSKGDTK